MSKGDVKVKLIGIYKSLAGKSEVSIKFLKPMTILSLLESLFQELGPNFKASIMDRELNDPRPNALILVNGVEISCLNGLQTEIKEEDEVTLVPITHGG